MVRDTKPQTVHDFLRDTSHVVRHLYMGIVSNQQLWEEATSLLTPHAGRPSETDVERNYLDTFIARGRDYFNNKMSEGVLCGGILQVAFSGIMLFSRNTTVPPKCEPLFEGVKRKEKKVRFCIGPLRHGVPEGLLIYAGRNQAAHWDDAQLTDRLNVNVFARLNRDFRQNELMDLAFDLSNPTIHVYANLVLMDALRWRTYGEYLRYMKNLLESTQQSG